MNKQTEVRTWPEDGLNWSESLFTIKYLSYTKNIYIHLYVGGVFIHLTLLCKHKQATAPTASYHLLDGNEQR